MNGNELLEKISEVDPKLIEDADKAAESPQKKKRALFIGITSGMATVAAALAIVAAINANSVRKPNVDINTSGYDVSGGADGVPGIDAGSQPGTNSTDKGADNSEAELTSASSGPLGTSNPEDLSLKPMAVDDEAFSGYDDLPQISNADYGVRGNGDGSASNGLIRWWETSLLPSELEIHSPWSVGAGLKTLPVYLSNSTTPDVDKMRKRIINAAAMLGIPESELEIINRGLNGVGDLSSYRKILEEHGLSEEEIEAELNRVSRVSGAQTSIGAESSRVNLYAYTDGSLWISFKEPYPELPEGYDLNEQDPSPDVMAATVRYFAEEYKELLGYQNPKIARYEGNFEYKYGVYEAEGDLESQIVNYRLKNCEFLVDWENPSGLDTLRVHTLENLEKLGDYPIYTPQQALWVLSSDSTPEEGRLPADAKIAKVDIVYNNLQGYTAVLPYYEFYVKSDEEPSEEGETRYKVYSIAAVPEQFIDISVVDYGVRA